MKLRAASTAAWSMLCVLVAHYAGYFLAFDDPHARQHALEGSGHSWYGLLLPASAFGLALGTFTTVLLARRDRFSRSGSMFRLYVFAALGLVSLEFTERLVHLGSLSETLHNLSTPASFLPVLLALVLLGLVVVPFVWAVREAITKAVSARALPAPSASRVRFPADPVWFASLLLESVSPRGPPLLPARIRA